MRLRRLVAIDLPRRLSKRLPGPVTEVAVGTGMTGLFVLVRMLAPLPSDAAPFALAYVSLALSTLIAGWRAGLVALVLGQLLIWYFLLPPYHSFALPSLSLAWGLIVTTLAQGLILAALGLYQGEVRRGRIERIRRINFLGHALREMDHRTRNNFQIVTSLLTLQAGRAAAPEAQAALREAADRLQAVSAVYAALRPSSAGLVAVRLQDQLQEMCDQIRRGILPDGISLETELEAVLVPADTAVAIGIIVNELVTNACKHAFPDGKGKIRISAARDGDAAKIEVADDGCGYPVGAGGKGKGGLGTRLVTAFVQRVGGTSDVRSSAGGTSHSIRVPLPQ
jgi:two-component sensor histidine kinase